MRRGRQKERGERKCVCVRARACVRVLGVGGWWLVVGGSGGTMAAAAAQQGRLHPIFFAHTLICHLCGLCDCPCGLSVQSSKVMALVANIPVPDGAEAVDAFLYAAPLSRVP